MNVQRGEGCDLLVPAGTRADSVLIDRFPDGRGMQRVGGYVGLPALIRNLGADPAAMLARAGLAPDAFDDPDRFVDFAAIGRLLAETASASECPHLGLLVGRLWPLSVIGLVGEVVRHSPTVGDALRTLVTHQYLNSSGSLAFLIERGDVVELGAAIYHPRTEGRTQIAEAMLVAGLNYLRELAGADFALSEVVMARAHPAVLQPYRSCFRVVPRFDADTFALRFSARWMAKPVAGADPVKLANARRRAEFAARVELEERLTRLLRVLMLSGDISGEAAASALAMHRRTLNRRLKDAGTTFQAILDDVRREVACQLLEGTRASLDDIASSLGYAGVSPFMRAFGRWTGTTPGRWRAGARGAGAFDHHDGNRAA